MEFIINMLSVCWVLIRCPLLRLATTRMPWEKHGTPNSLCAAILMGYELWLFTLLSPSLSLLQRTTPSRCGTCKRLLLPKSKYSTPTHKSNASKTLFQYSLYQITIDSYVSEPKWAALNMLLYWLAVRDTSTQTAVCLLQSLCTWGSRLSVSRKKRSVVD